MGYYKHKLIEEMRKEPLGFCPICNRPVWSDDEIFIDGRSYHNGCLDD